MIWLYISIWSVVLWTNYPLYMLPLCRVHFYDLWRLLLIMKLFSKWLMNSDKMLPLLLCFVLLSLSSNADLNATLQLTLSSPFILQRILAYITMLGKIRGMSSRPLEISSFGFKFCFFGTNLELRCFCYSVSTINIILRAEFTFERVGSFRDSKLLFFTYMLIFDGMSR
jgi:hypothetical protein